MVSKRRQFATYALLLCVIGIVTVGGMTLLGGHRVSQVFSQVDSGLSTSDGVSSPGNAQGEGVPVSNPAPVNAQTTVERLIIKHASLSLHVEDVEEAERQIQDSIEAANGYVVRTTRSGVDDEVRINMTFRVPAERFDQVLAQTQELATEVLSLNVSGDDVTAEYVDLESQVRNLEATRDRLLALMEKTQEVDDALEVSNALTNIQGQIEQIQGRMNYLSQSAALSTVDVSFSTPVEQPIVNRDSWQPIETARSAVRSLIGLGQFLVSLVIVAAIWVPIWGPLVLLGRWIYRRQQAGSNSPTPSQSNS